MAKVTVHRGVTISPKDTFHSYRADITIADIDTEGNVEEQIEEALEVHTLMSDAIEEPLAQDAANVSALSIEGMGISKQFAKFLVNDKAWKKSVVTEVKNLQNIIKDSTTK
ncbi:MAG: hypothetical protein QQN63_14210 [Nitrosopumilus sp.]